jgi:hypothetical protein
MYTNRLMYKSLQASNKLYFSQVLFCIDRALQIHWISCCECSKQERLNYSTQLHIQPTESYTRQARSPKHSDDDGKLPLKDQKGKPDKDHKQQFKTLKDIVIDNDQAPLASTRWRKFLEEVLLQPKEVSQDERWRADLHEAVHQRHLR